MDVRKLSNQFSTTVKAHQSQNPLSPNDLACGISTLDIDPLNPSRLIITTTHNHSLKLVSLTEGADGDFLTQKTDGFRELMSYESLRKPVRGMVCEEALQKLYLFGDGFQATVKYRSQ